MYTICNYIHMHTYIFLILEEIMPLLCYWFDNAPFRNIYLLAKLQLLGMRNFFQFVHQGSPRDSQNNIVY